MKALKEKRISLRSLWRRSLVILSLLALIFAACGGSDDSSGGNGYHGNTETTKPGRYILGIQIVEPPTQFLPGTVWEGMRVDLRGMVVGIIWSDDPTKVELSSNVEKFSVDPPYWTFAGSDNNAALVDYDITMSNAADGYVGVTLRYPHNTPGYWMERVSRVNHTGGDYTRTYYSDDIPSFDGMALELLYDLDRNHGGIVENMAPLGFPFKLPQNFKYWHFSFEGQQPYLRVGIPLNAKTPDVNVWAGYANGAPITFENQHDQAYMEFPLDKIYYAKKVEFVTPPDFGDLFVTTDNTDGSFYGPADPRPWIMNEYPGDGNSHVVPGSVSAISVAYGRKLLAQPNLEIMVTYSGDGGTRKYSILDAVYASRPWVSSIPRPTANDGYHGLWVTGWPTVAEAVGKTAPQLELYFRGVQFFTPLKFYSLVTGIKAELAEGLQDLQFNLNPTRGVNKYPDYSIGDGRDNITTLAAKVKVMATYESNHGGGTKTREIKYDKGGGVFNGNTWTTVPVAYPANGTPNVTYDLARNFGPDTNGFGGDPGYYTGRQDGTGSVITPDTPPTTTKPKASKFIVSFVQTPIAGQKGKTHTDNTLMIQVNNN